MIPTGILADGALGHIGEVIAHGAEPNGIPDRGERAGELAGELGGDVVDDNRAPFGAEAAAIIRGQIGQFQSRMADHDIPAGSPLALRLFSL